MEKKRRRTRGNTVRINWEDIDGWMVVVEKKQWNEEGKIYGRGDEYRWYRDEFHETEEGK